jgi:hypothetical protein
VTTTTPSTTRAIESITYLPLAHDRADALPAHEDRAQPPGKVEDYLAQAIATPNLRALLSEKLEPAIGNPDLRRQWEYGQALGAALAAARAALAPDAATLPAGRRMAGAGARSAPGLKPEADIMRARIDLLSRAADVLQGHIDLLTQLDLNRKAIVQA